jgi:uncharacterized membrane protein YphA (DoxX/SURF4 family)
LQGRCSTAEAAAARGCQEGLAEEEEEAPSSGFADLVSTPHRATRIVHWVTTVAFVAPMVWSAIQYFTLAPKMVATMTHLGYPLYFLKILGVAKVLGAAALLFPRAPRLKEWAYAGFTFDVIGAAISHLAVGDGAAVAAVPIGFLALLAASYVTWRKLEGSRL